MAKNLMFALVSIWITVIAKEYVIERRATKHEDIWPIYWISQPDRFIIPSSVCSGDGSVQCTAMGGTRISNCMCECNVKQNEIFYKSTFGFFNNQWKCTENSIIYTSGGCSIRLEDRSAMKPLVTVPMMVPSQTYNIPNLITQRWPWSFKYSITNGEYLKCNGTWSKITSDLVKKRFSVTEKYWNHFCLEYKTNQPSDSAINGRVLKIKIDVQRQLGFGRWTWNSTKCVVLKVKGKLICPFSLKPLSVISTSMPTLLPSTATPSSSHLSLSSTPVSLVIHNTIQEESSTLLALDLTPASTIATIPLSTSRATLTQNREQNDPEYETSTLTFATSQAVVKNHKKSTRKDDDNSGLIAGALAGVIGFAVVIVLIVIMRRSKKRDNADSAKNTTVVENPGYERGVDNSLKIADRGQRSQDEDEYSYAYTSNAVPFVKSKRQDMEPKSVCGKTEELQVSPPHLEAPVYNTIEEPEYARPNKSKKVHQSSSDAPIHNTLEEPEYARPNKSRKVHQICADAPSHNTLEELGYAKPNKSRKVHQTCADAPIYNTLEEPEYGKVNKGGNTKLPENKNEPLYNVLEGPDAEHDEEQSEEPPCYHVLEGPFPDGAPVYDVLEGPEPGETPVYGSLDGPDPHVYGTLDMCDTEGAFKDNREYNDIVYDSVGEVVNDTGNIYQQLNQSGQEGSDVYQGLSYPDKTMYLKDLNKSHSNA